MTCQPRDRGVLTAAVRSGAEFMVAFNGKEFPAESIAPDDLDARTPDDFLLDRPALFRPGYWASDFTKTSGLRDCSSSLPWPRGIPVRSRSRSVATIPRITMMPK